jgi:hypothetical protein
MQSNTAIETEIKILRKALSFFSSRWNDQARLTIEETIRVLDQRMTREQVERKYYVDETAEEFSESDNELYHALMLVVCWMEGERGYKAPSENL